MSIELTWFGHGTWQISLPEHTILLDPFFDDNPSSPIKAAEVDADFILISHGHFDHIADAAAVANRTNATVVAIYEVAQWLAQNGEVKETIGMNIVTAKHRNSQVYESSRILGSHNLHML